MNAHIHTRFNFTLKHVTHEREIFTFYMISKYMNVSYVSGGINTNKQKLNKQIYQEDACSGRKYALVLNKALSIGPWGLLCTISGQ